MEIVNWHHQHCISVHSSSNTLFQQYMCQPSLHCLLLYFSFFYFSGLRVNHRSPQHLPHVSSYVSQPWISCTPAATSPLPRTPRHPTESWRSCPPPPVPPSSSRPAPSWSRAVGTLRYPLWRWKGRRTLSPTRLGGRSPLCLDPINHQGSPVALSHPAAFFLSCDLFLEAS